MISKKLVSFSFLLGLICANRASPTLNLRADVIERNEVLDQDGRYRVHWKYYPTEKSVTFKVIAETIGFVGFGLSPVGGMAGSDIVIGGINSNGEAYFSDRHGTGNMEPVVDEEQNWLLESVTENQTHTVLQFSRTLDTCDVDDVAIGNGTVNFIWSMGSTDTISYHGSYRGTYMVNVLDPPMPPLDTSEFKSWDMLVNQEMPDAHTTYWCTIHKSPTLSSKHHIVGFRPQFPTTDALKYTHHMIVHSCVPPEGVSADEAFGQYVGNSGAECYKSSPLIPEQLCKSYLFVWAVGGKTVIYPEHVGYPFAEDGDSNYYMLEVHYNNPQLISGLAFETGLELFYTDKLRTYDAGTLTSGHETRWTITVPPNASDFKIIGHCAPACSNNIPEGGINIFNVLLHSHLSGRKLKIRHFRNNVELPWLASDDNYNFDYQQNRPLVEEVKILPGDHLIYECTYDTFWKGSSVVGGLSTENEMCNTFIWYYPRIPLHTCSSEFPKNRLMKGLGIEEMLNGGSTEDPIITAPESMAGLTYTQVLDQIIPWTPAQRELLQEELRFGAHTSVCKLQSGSVEQFAPREVNQLLVSYPVVDKEYSPPNQCVE